MGIAAVIMAGGRGERFWPSSREDMPKQFLAFQGERTLIQQTVSRLAGIADPQDVWVVTREDYAGLVYEQVPNIPRQQVLLEPQGRDTAPCVALAALSVAKRDPDAVMVMLPSDHLVLQEERFREALAASIRVAASGEYLVTIGICPTRPETGYGYISTGPLVDVFNGHEAYRVSAFKEKPSREMALAYLQQGGYYWNSGIFVWKVSTILAALQEHMPQLLQATFPLADAIGTERESAVLSQVYPTLPKISIDYGVMERAANTVVIPADFGWDDLGTWAALERVILPDDEGNILRGRVVAVETQGSVVQSLHNRLVATLGVSDIVVVDSEDAVLIAHKTRVTDLKAIVGRLEEEGLHQHLKSPSGSKT